MGQGQQGQRGGFQPKEVSEEKAMEEGLTKAPQKGTPESTPRLRMLTRTAAGIAVRSVIG